MDLDTELPRQSSDEVPERISKRLSFRDKVLYIYTSGTTGLPKAAVVKNARCDNCINITDAIVL